MKILFVTNKMPYPPKDGGSIATFQHIWELANLGQEITVLAINTKKHFFPVNSIPQEISSKVTFKTLFVDTDISTFDAVKNLFFSNLPYNAERFLSKEFETLLIETLQEKEFDIVQLEGLYLCPYIAIIRQYSKAKVSYRAHNIEHEIWGRALKHERNLMKQRYLKLLTHRLEIFEKEYVNSYDLLVPITSRDAVAFEELGNTKPMLVSPTGIDPKHYIPKPEMILFPSFFHIGALDWFPNQEGLLWFLRSVWRYFSKDYPQINFHIAGRNAPKWLIEEFAKFRNVVFVGEVEDAHAFLNAYSIMVVPILSGGGMRVKIIEGMALAKTIVTTPIGAEGISVNFGKHMYLANDSEEFRYCIETLVKNRELCDEIGNNAREFVQKHFDSKIIAKKLLDFYTQHANAH